MLRREAARPVGEPQPSAAAPEAPGLPIPPAREVRVPVASIARP
jgi:hypothetical protein